MKANAGWCGLLALGLLCAAGLAQAADKGSGAMSKGDKRVDARHAIAVLRDKGADASEAEILVYLSEKPVDRAKVAASFNGESVVERLLGDADIEYVRICIGPDGETCGLYFSPGSFSMSGSGEFKLDATGIKRVAGRWHTTEPQTFFDETYELDLRWDAVPVPLPGQPLPAGGGDPGKAYKAWVAAVAKGNPGMLKKLAAPDYQNWQLESGSLTSRREAVQELRDNTPLAPEIVRGRSSGNQAVLWVRGRDRDDILRAGRVQLQRVDGDWYFAGASLESEDENED